MFYYDQIVAWLRWKNRIYTKDFYFEPIVDYPKVVHEFSKRISRVAQDTFIKKSYGHSSTFSRKEH